MTKIKQFEPDYKRAAEYFQKLAQIFAPEKLDCPKCYGVSGKLNMGILFTDAFVMIYECRKCKEIFSASIAYPDAESMLVSTCGVFELTMIIECCEESAEMEKHINQLARQRRRERKNERGYRNE